MVKSIPALVNPVLLKHGRDAVNLDLERVAKKLNIDVQVLEDWESGNSYPTLVQFRKMAKLYKRSEAFFYLPGIPKKIKKREADYRTLFSGSNRASKSYELISFMEEVSQKQSSAIDLLIELEDDPKPSLPLGKVEQDPEVLAEEIRERLNISIQRQLQWKKPYEALRDWINSVESLGVLVFKSSRASIDVQEMRGYAIWSDILPVIVLNSKDRNNGKIFTLMHELVHLCLRQNSLFISEFDFNQKNQKSVEAFCNHVAGSILVPQKALLNNTFIRNLSGADYFPDEELRDIAKHFNVSQTTLLIRLLKLGKISNQCFKDKYAYILSLPIPDEEKGFSRDNDYSSQIISKQGRLYPEIILRSFYEEKIDITQASLYLNAKIKHFKSLEEAIFG